MYFRGRSARPSSATGACRYRLCPFVANNSGQSCIPGNQTILAAPGSTPLRFVDRQFFSLPFRSSRTFGAASPGPRTTTSTRWSPILNHTSAPPTDPGSACFRSIIFSCFMPSFVVHAIRAAPYRWIAKPMVCAARPGETTPPGQVTSPIYKALQQNLWAIVRWLAGQRLRFLRHGRADEWDGREGRIALARGKRGQGESSSFTRPDRPRKATASLQSGSQY